MRKGIGYQPTQKTFLDKLKKHSRIISSRLNESKEISRVKSINNSLLSAVIDAFQKTKSNNFSLSEQGEFENVENYRKQLLQNEQVITYEIFNSELKRTVKQVCSICASPKIWGRFMYALIDSCKASKVLEIGTNVGISGSYMLHALKDNTNATFDTMEGVQSLCAISQEAYETIVNKKHFNIVQGLYEDTFPSILSSDYDYDILFIDGNHRKDATMEYYDKLLNKVNDRAIFIFDDIYYSTGMTEAWQYVKGHKKTNFSIDMYKQGIVVVDDSESHFNEEFKFHLAY